MADPIPLYQELHLPVVPPEVLEKMKKAEEPKTWRRIVIDLNGDAPDEKSAYDQDD